MLTKVKTMMDSILVSNVVYILKLEDDCWYVGTTSNFNYRLAQHNCGQGSKWTRAHKPVAIAEVLVGGTAVEKAKTLEYMSRYGFKVVRGGGWCQMEIRDDPTKK